MKLVMALAAVAMLCGCNRPAQAQMAAAESAAQCLARDGSGAALEACTRAIEAGGLSPDMRALLYNARGETHCARAEYDLALADQNAAIALKPRFAQAYVDRASCYLGKADIKSALANYDEALRLAPDVLEYHRLRAKLRNWAGDHQGALADYDAAIRLAPDSLANVDERAKTLFNLQRYDEAAAGFVADIRLSPGDFLPVLWLHVARARAHHPDTEEFQAGMKTLDLSGWPRPLFDIFLGKTTVEAIHMSGATSDPEPDAECEEALFGGEYDLIRGDTAAAMPRMQEAASVCDHTTNYFLTAWAELKRLDPTVRSGPW